MEVWHRKKRQFLCDREVVSLAPGASDVDRQSTGKSTCLISDEDLETATCADKKKPLADAFKVDIECGWGAADRCQAHLTIFISVMVYIMIY